MASCDLRLHVGLHFRCNERLRHLWYSEQATSAPPQQRKAKKTVARRTKATSNRSNRTPTTRGKKAAARGKEKTKKRRLGALHFHQKRPRNALRAASEVLRRPLALLKCLWKRLGPLLRGLGEAPGTSRGALGSVLGSSESVSETISGGF